MNVWPTTTVGELVDRDEADLQTGPFGTQLKASDYVDEGTPVINVRNVGFGDIREHDLEFVDDAMVQKLHVHQLRKGDIVFGRKGAVERHALIDDHADGWIQGSDCLRLRLDSPDVSRKFLSHYFKTQAHQDWMQAVCSFGATMNSLNQDIVRRISFPHPPLPIQRKIVAVLSAYDEKIANSKKRISLVSETVEQVYREWFVRMRFPGHKAATFRKGVPVNWEPKTIADIATTQYGYTASASTEECGPKMLRITDIVPDTINWGRVPFCPIDESDEAKYLLSEGDILVARTGATVGYAKRINKLHPKAVFASYLVRIKASNEIDSMFLGLSVERQHFKNFISMFVTGAAQPQANATTMSRFPFFYPGEEILQDFNALVQPMLDQKELLCLEIERLNAARKMLLARLISGQLPVADLKILFPPQMTSDIESAEGTETEPELVHA
jgi:type I restriction enzyme S subunit